MKGQWDLGGTNGIYNTIVTSSTYFSRNVRTKFNSKLYRIATPGYLLEVGGPQRRIADMDVIGILILGRVPLKGFQRNTFFPCTVVH